MPQRPRSILIFTLIYLLSPAFILVQAAIMARLPLFGRVSLFSRLTPGDCLVLALYIVCAVSVFSVRRWGWYLFMLASLALAAYNIRIAFLRPTQSAVLLALVYDIALLSAAGFFFRRNVIAPYFNPRLRWWESERRYGALCYVLIGSGDARFSANIVDISASGCFIRAGRTLRLGSEIPVEIHCFGEGIAVSAKVTRKAELQGSEGYELMFVRPDGTAAAALEDLSSRLSNSGLADPEPPWRDAESVDTPERAWYRTENDAAISVAGTDYGATILDISKKGCLLMAKCDAPLGERYAASLHCLNERLGLEGTVRWKTRSGKAVLLGIAFVFGDRGQSRRVAALVHGLKAVGAMERNARKKPLDDRAILEYSLRTPYRFIHRILKPILK